MDSSFIRPGADASRARREAGAAPPRGWRTWLFGRPLPTADAPDEAIGKTVGLAVFSSDALSSTAYATQEIMIILAMAGTAALSFVLPISVAIVVLLAIVTFSYEQTIHAYPGGGGAYIVARDNLGVFPAQVAGAALLMDYILTVAVSDLLGGRPGGLRLPGRPRPPGDARDRARGLRDGRQPAGGEGVGLSCSRCPRSSSWR